MEGALFNQWGSSVPAGLIMIATDGTVSYFNDYAANVFNGQLQTKNKWSDVLMKNVSGTVENGHYLVFRSNRYILLKTQALEDAKGQVVLLIDETEYVESKSGISMLKKENRSHSYSKNAIFNDPESKKILELADKVAKTDASILISGESGTGKEVVARYVHEVSSRKDFPFIAINCAAIPDNMLEAILFGYEKGAFTGAVQTTEGKLEQGDRGTILLDEISEMPIGLQAKLLRVLQEREVERLGGKKTIKLDVRIIATTNKILQEEVEKGNFRQDLYFRLNVFPIRISPLRERKGDILDLANYFLKKYAIASNLCKLSAEAEKKLILYHWYGNIRELQNVIQRAVIFSKNNVIEADNIIFEDLKTESVQNNEISEEACLSEKLTDKENGLILNMLNELNGNRSACAEKLGISARTLRNKLSRMKKMGIQIPN